jgi:GNAT superfamily N-acetyltransferase
MSPLSYRALAVISPDLNDFRELWAEYLEETFKEGDPVRPSESNLRYFSNLAREFITNPDSGVVVVAYDRHIPVGVVMWGWSGDQLETTYGKTAVGWGTYVRPSYRCKQVSNELRKSATAWLKDKEFEAVQGSVRTVSPAAVKSAESFGFKATDTIVMLELND